MKIHAYILCYNEQDIICQVLSYYSQICSKIFLLDNYSTDSSVQLASTFKKVKILRWSSGNRLDDRMNIQIKEKVYKAYSRAGGRNCEEVADWVITCDMDELIYHPRLTSVLELYRSQKATVANVVGFNMVSTSELATIRCLIGEVRNGVQAKTFNKPILFDPSFDMVFSVGCHPSGNGYERMKNQFGYRLGKERIALLHYKFIGKRFLNKAKVNGSRLSDANLLNNFGQHYQKTTVELRKKNNEMCLKARRVIDSSGDIIY